MAKVHSANRIPEVVLHVRPNSTCRRGFLRGIAKYSHLHGPWSFIVEYGEYRKKLHQLLSKGPDAIVMHSDDRKEIDYLTASKLPGIIMQGLKREVPGFINLIDDNSEIGKIGAEYLIKRGFKDLAFCGFSDRYWSVDRKISFSQAVEQAGLKFHLYKSKHSRIDHSWKQERNNIAKWLGSAPKPLGLMVCDDNHCRRVLEVCKIADINVPEEVAILGVDNDDLYCELYQPSLSSIALNSERAGYEAAKMLDRLLAGQQLQTQTVTIRAMSVVTRQSTDILTIEDAEVAKAVQFIHRNARTAIQVRDVIEATALTRRTLYPRFKETMQRSIHKEIQRVRADEIAQMLVETNLSIAEIASSLKFYGIDHISRFFRRTKGITPLAYRRKYGQK